MFKRVRHWFGNELQVVNCNMRCLQHALIIAASCVMLCNAGLISSVRQYFANDPDVRRNVVRMLTPPNSQPKVYSALVSVNFNSLTLDIGFGWMLALVCLFLCWRTSSSSCYTCFTNPSVLRYAVSREHLIFSCWVWVPAKFSRHHFFKLIFSENVQQCYYCCFLTVCLENSHFIVFCFFARKWPKWCRCINIFSLFSASILSVFIFLFIRPIS